MNKRICSILIMVIGVMSCCWAQTIITDRPDQTEASSTVPKRSFQIETGFIVQQNRVSRTDFRSIAAPTTLFRYGLFKWGEIRVVTQFNATKQSVFGNSTRKAGFADLQVGTKLQLFKRDSSKHEVAFLTHLIAPTGSEGQSLERFGVINKLSISHALCERVGLGYNLGYDYYGTGKGQLTWSASLGFRPVEKLGLFVEPYGAWAEFDAVVASFDAGVTYLILNNLQWDFSFGFGLNHQMNFMSTGISWNIAPK